MSSAEKSDDDQIGAEGQDEMDNENKDDGHGSTNIQFVKSDYIKIIKGNFVGLFASVIGDGYGDELKIQYFKNSTNILNMINISHISYLIYFILLPVY